MQLHLWLLRLASYHFRTIMIYYGHNGNIHFPNEVIVVCSFVTLLDEQYHKPDSCQQTSVPQLLLLQRC